MEEVREEGEREKGGESTIPFNKLSCLKFKTCAPTSFNVLKRFTPISAICSFYYHSKTIIQSLTLLEILLM